jgi:hypothetical protein
MKLPFISRKEYDEKVADLEGRIADLERHFVTKRNAEGGVIETLADVPLAKRSEKKKASLKGLTWPQKKRLLEISDGGRREI